MEISKAFVESGIDLPAPAVLQKCGWLCEAYGLSAQKLTNQLDAFLCGNGGKLSLENIGAFEQSLQELVHQANSHQSGTQRTILSEKTSKRAAHFSPTQDSKSKKTSFASAKISPASIQYDTPPSQPDETSFENRENAGQVVLEFNKELGKRGQFEASALKPVGSRCKVSVNSEDFDGITKRYRFMFTTMQERTLAMEKQIAKLEASLCQMVELSPDDLQPVGVPSQNLVWVCGKICAESATGKLTATSVMLEGSRGSSSGRRVALDLSETPSYSLFQGQVVLVQGINSTGRKMAVKMIVTGAPAPRLQSTPTRLLEWHHSKHYQGGQPLQAVVAAGPFTLSSNLEYEPLQLLLQDVLRTKPDVLILIGPFVDITQPMLAAGDVTLLDRDDGDKVVGEHAASYEMVFVEKVVRDGLLTLFNSEEDFGTIPTNIILIPSLHDAHHEFVFPQPPFGDRDAITSNFFDEPLGVLDIPFSRDDDPKKRIHLLPNPCMFRINEVLFGISSLDMLMSLAADEISLNAAEPHRLGRLLGHLLQQQSFCPQFPAPQTFSHQLDMRQHRHWSMTVSPDVLIMPSRLTHLCKDVAGTLVINPGHVVKGNKGGTIAEMHIHPCSEDRLRQEHIDGHELISHNVPARSYVRISKI